jgi:hypothetical protein
MNRIAMKFILPAAASTVLHFPIQKQMLKSGFSPTKQEK